MLHHVRHSCLVYCLVSTGALLPCKTDSTKLSADMDDIGSLSRQVQLYLALVFSNFNLDRKIIDETSRGH